MFIILCSEFQHQNNFITHLHKSFKTTENSKAPASAREGMPPLPHITPCWAIPSELSGYAPGHTCLLIFKGKKVMTSTKADPAFVCNVILTNVS